MAPTLKYQDTVEHAEAVLLAHPEEIGWTLGSSTPQEAPVYAVMICPIEGNPQDYEYLAYTAARAGWWYVSAYGRWFAPGDAVPEPNKDELVQEFALKLQAIRYGYI